MTQVPYATDHELETAVLDELACTLSVRAVAIDVTLSSGAVTLSGEVETYSEKHEAIRAAMRVHGVTAVADDIVVRNGRAPRNDTDIAVEATEILDRIVSLPAGAVQVLVHDHVVRLSGAVAWAHQREATRRAMATLRGVNAVVNTITLTPGPTASATDATRKIIATLVRTPGPTPKTSATLPAPIAVFESGFKGQRLATLPVAGETWDDEPTAHHN